MKSILTILIGLIACCALYAQVGIGNTNPKATLDISASNTTTPTNADGILIPRIDDFSATNPGADQDGMMVFVTGNGTPAKGFYYWDNGSTSWISVKDTDNQTIDVLNLNGTNLEVSLEDDGEATQNVDLSSLSSSNFAATRVESFSGTASNVGKVNYYTVLYDLNNNWHISLKRFNVTEDGLYRITAQLVVRTGSFTGQRKIGLDIKRNGSSIFKNSNTIEYYDLFDRRTITITTMYYLYAGQYIEIYNNSTIPLTVSPSDGTSIFEVERIR